MTSPATHSSRPLSPDSPSPDPLDHRSPDRLSPDASTRARVWRRRFFLVIAAWMLWTVLLSFSPVRAIVAYPLYVHDQEAAGEAAYVMADGPAYWERLRAASDLYHWHRVKQIVILEEERSDGYNFVRHKSDSRLERSIAYLALYGVPNEDVFSVPETESAAFGSSSEARGLATHFPKLKEVVVVTSAPHTRRSLLCFQRALPLGSKIQVYAASPMTDSDEIHSPIWIEYAKLVVYYFLV